MKTTLPANKRPLTIFLILLVGCALLNAQPNNSYMQDVVLPAPNVASLAKFNEIPISYHTGVPSITIPFFTVKDGPLSLPISLDYHSAGVKVAETASWVGQGWNLSAGGLISRTVLSYPDETPTHGYFHHGANLTGSSYELLEQIIPIIGNPWDTEPDIFFFSFPGYSGKFYIDKDHIPVLMPKQDLKIERYEYGSNVFHRFDIIAPDGTRYIFGHNPVTGLAARENTEVPGGLANGNTTTWNLVRVESYDKKFSITLEYVNENYSYTQLASCSNTFLQCVGQSGNYGYQSTIGCQSSYTINGQYYHRENIWGKRLTKIYSSLETVDFLADTDREDLEVNNSNNTGLPNRLDNVEISTGTYCQRFTLSYDYFQDMSNSNLYNRPEAKRLKLLSVTERSCVNSGPSQVLNPPYVFTYEGPSYTQTINNISVTRQFIPWRLSKEIDHWGYYNGPNGNNSPLNIVNVPPTTISIPNTTNLVNYGSANRDSKESVMLYGVLKNIAYPTGGNTSFVFEANDRNELTTTVTNLNPPLKVQNIGTPDPLVVCTNTESTTIQTYTFPSAPTPNLKFKMELINVCPGPTDGWIQITVTNESTGQQYGMPVSFNAAPYETETTPLLTFMDYFPNVPAGVSIKFKLLVRNGRGTFEVFSSTTSEEIKKIGGLRIKEVRSKDGVSSSNDIVRTYEYKDLNNATRSSGTLMVEPRYGYTGSGIDGQGNQIYYITFSANSLVPLGGFSGEPIIYSSVQEYLNGNGKNTYQFTLETNPPPNNIFPFIPAPFNVLNGKLNTNKSYNQNGTEIQQISQTADNQAGTYSYETGIIYKTYIFNICSGGNPPSASPSILKTNYQPRTASYRVKQIDQSIDGVNTVTVNYFDPLNRHDMPVKTEITNSDGKLHQTEYTYNHSYPTVSIRDSLLKKNLIAQPYKTDIKVNNTQLSGTELEYAFFNNTTGAYQTSSTGAMPRPYKFYNFEKTWNSSGTLIGPGKTLKATINDYDAAGNPKTFTKDGWQPETYTWQNGLIKTRTFQGYVWTYDYITGTRLLSKITDIDGQATEFEYDALMRLTKSKGRKTGASTFNVQTEYSYNIGGTIANNYVKTRNIFTPTAGSSLTEQSVWQYFDGLGRPVQTVEQKKSPDQKDIVNRTSYDNQGRPYRQFVPAKSTFNTGQYVSSTLTPHFTLTQYEASPLNRPLSVTPPTWYATTTTYGKNAANEVKFDGGSTFYAADLLNKTTVTDPNGNKTTTFTDKLGRLILTRKEDSAGNNDTDTYNLYDDKNRLTKVLPPDATLSTLDLLFQYTYDEKDRLTTKKVPDAAAMTYWYNNRDLMIFMQDGNLLAANQRLCTHHDVFGRPIKTGFVSHSSPPTGNDPQPLTADILTETTYGTSGISKGKVTYSKARELGTANYLDTYYYYDAFGRLSYTTGDNHLYSATTAERTDFTYDHADNILTQFRDHQPNSGSTTTVDETFTYDHWGRPLDHFHKINTGPNVRIANNAYDDRSRLVQKNLHLTATGHYLQNLDYFYNQLDWLTAINTFQCMSPDPPASAEAPTGEGFEIEAGFGPAPDGGKATARFTVRLTGKIGTDDVLAEKVYDLTAQPDSSYLSDLQTVDFGSVELPHKATHSLAGEKVTYDRIAALLLEIEEKMLREFSDAGLDGLLAHAMANVLQSELEQAWQPILAAGALAAAGNATEPDGTEKANSNDLFALKLYYDAANTALGAPLQKNGNIAWLGWQVGCNDPAYYGMTYDHLDRLKKATYADLDKTTLAYKNLNRYNLNTINYDKRGNISSKVNRGLISGTTYGIIDNLSYGYTAGKNQLNNLKELSLNNKGYKTVAANNYAFFTYDANGNMKTDGGKAITNIEYNHLNLPKRVTWPNGNWVEWAYDANGTKLKKTTSAGAVKHYINGIEYSGSTIEAVYHAEGRASLQSGTYRYEYTLRDHLGNSRVMFADLNGNNEVTEAEILQQNHYYPFGMNMEGSWAGGTNKYQYNGKVMAVGADITDPKNGGLGMEYISDFGLDVNFATFRTFDPAIGRFWQVDPVLEEFEAWSPYTSNLDNPIRYNDPDGDCPRCIKAIAKTVVKSIAKGKVDLGEIYDIVDNGITLLSPNSTLAERGEAAFNLISPVSTKEAKAVGKAVGVVDDAKDAKKAGDIAKKQGRTKADEIKQIGPAGDAGATVTKQIPENWEVKNAKKGNGTRFTDPSDPKGNNVRVMQGDPSSPHTSQQIDYVKHTKGGTSVDKKGNPVKYNAPEAHIPKDEFKIKQ